VLVVLLVVKPPAISTLPFASSVGRGRWRALELELVRPFVAVHVFAFGSYSSGAAKNVVDAPPMTSTFPFPSRVAVGS